MQLAFSPADPDAHAASHRDACLPCDENVEQCAEAVATASGSPHSVASAELGANDAHIRMDWFEQGISEQNCALFEAAVYSVRPLLAKELAHRLASQGSPTLVADNLALNLIVDDLVMYAFEQADRWHPGDSVCAWLLSLMDELIADLPA